MKILSFLVFVLLLSNVSALCEEGQIDINTASAEELDGLHGIGPVKAESIISSRPFNSLDDLIDVNGIGEVTLSNIKAQELACVGEENGEEKEVLEENLEETSETEDSKEEVLEISIPTSSEPEPETIILNPKVIKTENGKEVSEENNNYAIYGFVAFGVLIVALFLVRRNKYKNEFN